MVQQLQERLATTSWLSIYGQIGVGKTHVVAILSEEIGRCDAWIRLRDTGEDLAIRRLKAAMRHLAQRSKAGSGRIEEAVAHALGSGGVFVCDDIPRIGARSEFWERLVTLVKAFAKTGAKLVTTSNYAVPAGVRGLLLSTALHESECPLLEDSEIAEILHALGAPGATIDNGIVPFLRGLSRGHPLLVSAAGRYLHQQGWQVDADVLRSLLSGGHVVDIGQETLERLIESAEDPEGRDLLYRLMLVTGTFTMAHVLALAAAPCRLERPNERLTPLLGSWVQRDGCDRYALSPLLSVMPGKQLFPETEKACHLALAELIYRSPSVSPDEFRTMISHYAMAEENEKALTLLAHGLHDLLAAPPDAWDGGVSELWARTALPGTIDVDRRAHIRAMQIAVRLARGKDNDWLMDDLESLLDECDPRSWARIIVAAMLSLPLFDAQPRRAVKYLLCGLAALPTAVMPDGNRLKASAAESFERLPLLQTSGVVSIDHLNVWLSSFSELNSEHRARLIADPAFEHFVPPMFDRLGRLESDKPEPERRWALLDAALRDAAEKGLRCGAPMLWSAAVRARTTIIGEYEGRVDDAVALGRAALGQATTSHDRFMLNEAVGRQLLFTKRFEEARFHLEQAADDPQFQEHPLMISVLQHASWATGEQSPERAADYSDRAVRLVRAIAADHHVEVLRATGERAVAHWLAGHQEQAIDCLSDGAALVCGREDESAEWRRVALLLGRAIFGIGDALSGRLQPESLTGADTMFIGRGMFHLWQPDPELTLDSRFRARLAAKMCATATHLGRAEDAVRWAETAVMLAENSAPEILIYTHPVLIEDRLMTNRIKDSIELAIALADQLAAARGLPVQVSRADLALLYGVAPVAFRICSASASDRDLARKLSAEAVDALRGTAHGSDLKLKKAASFLEDAFISSGSGRNIYREAAEGLGGEVGLQIVGYACAMGCANTNPRDALMLCMSVAAAVAQEIGGIRPLWRRFLGFLTDYWTEVFRRSRFQFAAPAVTETDLEAAVGAPEERRAQAILRTVADGLRVQPPGPVQAWLKT